MTQASNILVQAQPMHLSRASNFIWHYCRHANSSKDIKPLSEGIEVHVVAIEPKNWREVRSGRLYYYGFVAGEKPTSVSLIRANYIYDPRRCYWGEFFSSSHSTDAARTTYRRLMRRVRDCGGFSTTVITPHIA